MFSWFSKAAQRRRACTSRSRPGPKVRPCLESLEDRWLPSQIGLTVSSLADSGPGTLRAAIATANPAMGTGAFVVAADVEAPDGFASDVAAVRAEKPRFGTAVRSAFAAAVACAFEGAASVVAEAALSSGAFTVVRSPVGAVAASDGGAPRLSGSAPWLGACALVGVGSCALALLGSGAVDLASAGAAWLLSPEPGDAVEVCCADASGAFTVASCADAEFAVVGDLPRPPSPIAAAAAWQGLGHLLGSQPARLRAPGEPEAPDLDRHVHREGRAAEARTGPPDGRGGDPEGAWRRQSSGRATTTGSSG